MTRTSTSTRRSKGARSRGGSTHFVTNLSVAVASSESLPNIAVIPFIHGGMWMDNQGDYWEGTMDATRIVHIEAWVDLWRNTPLSSDIRLKLPVIVGFALIDLFDSIGTGNPNDFTPICLPNLFQRSFGRRERGLLVSPDAPNATPFDDGLRVLQRQPLLLSFGELDDLQYNQGSVHWRSRKGFTIRRLSALCLVVGAYNTNLEDNHQIGIRLFSHFGYRHFVSGG